MHEFEWEFIDPLQPTPRKVKGSIKDGKLRRSIDVMGSDGKFKEHYVEFNGHSVDEMNAANIRYITVNDKSLRYKLCQPLIRGLKWMLDKLQSVQLGSKVHILSDAERIDLAFPTSIYMNDIELPLFEKFSMWVVNNRHRKGFSWLYKKLHDYSKRGQINKPLSEYDFEFSDEYRSRTPEEWRKNPKEWEEAYIAFKRRVGRLTLMYDFQDIKFDYSIDDISDINANEIEVPETFDYPSVEILRDGELPEGFEYPHTEVGVEIPGKGLCKGPEPYVWEEPEEPKEELGSDLEFNEDGSIKFE
jgi:hypothetical protein